MIFRRLKLLNRIFCLFLFFLPLASFASQSFIWDEFIAEIQKASVEKKNAIIENFIQEQKGSFPLVQGTKAIFIYYGKGQEVAIAGDFNGWQPVSPMIQISETNLWYLVQEFPGDSRMEYKIVVDKEWILDPLNPKKDLGGYGYNSDIWMPSYKSPAWFNKQVAENKGEVQSFIIESKILGNSRKLQVYTPYQYDPTMRYPLLIVHDGDDYIKMAYATKLMDLLIQEKRIGPLVVAFIDPVKRFEEYGCSEEYYEFTKTELVPFLEKNFSITSERSHRAFAGASMGGVVSFYLAYKMHESFGKALCQSGAFLFRETKGKEENPKIGDVLESIDYSKIQNSRFWLDCGTIGPLEQFLLQGNHILRNKLSQKGIPYSYKELPEAHNWGSWRKILEDALVYLFAEIYPQKTQSDQEK